MYLTDNAVFCATSVRKSITCSPIPGHRFFRRAIGTRKQTGRVGFSDRPVFSSGMPGGANICRATETDLPAHCKNLFVGSRRKSVELVNPVYLNRLANLLGKLTEISSLSQDFLFEGKLDSASLPRLLVLILSQRPLNDKIFALRRQTL